jgi:hypothetical protein
MYIYNSIDMEHTEQIFSGSEKFYFFNMSNNITIKCDINHHDISYKDLYSAYMIHNLGYDPKEI